jgi:hypothetical protein
MTFSFARVGAAVGMRVEDYLADGKRWRLRLNEKGGKVHEMLAHHNLEAYLDAYMHAALITSSERRVHNEQALESVRHIRRGGQTNQFTRILQRFHELSRNLPGTADLAGPSRPAPD